MTKDEFLKLLGKGQPDADEKLIVAVEKVFEEGAKSENIKHAESIETLAAAYDVLEHYGIDGQQWGVRNGPPYPLSRQKHDAVSAGSSKDKKANRKQLSSSDKAKKVISNIEDMSVQEIEEWIKRIEFEKKLEAISQEDKKKGEGMVRNLLSSMGDTLIKRAVPVVTMYAITKAFEKFGYDELASAFSKKM